MATGQRARRHDLAAAAALAAVVAAAVVVGAVLRANRVPIHARTAPLFGDWQQQAGPSSAIAVGVAALVVWYGPVVAQRIRWPALLVAAWATAAAWIFSLGLVAGWDRLAGKLERHTEYLHEVPAAPPVPELFATFADRIVAGQPDSWTTHVAGHPPGALAFFVLLDRVGLGGGAWAIVVVSSLGATACVAVAVAVRSADSEAMARRALPFLVLAPAAVWIGTSADGLFLAVSAWGVALLAVACRRRAGPGMAVIAAAAGLLFGVSLYLSYGLVLIGTIALAVLTVTRRVVPGVIALGGVLAVVLVTTWAGFAWWDGMHLVTVRYYQGWGATRPYSYWVWANLAAVALAAGPAVAPGIRRAVIRVARPNRDRQITERDGVGTAAVVLAAVAAIIAANLSGLSKGEVERIWLPFTGWLIAACALLPRRDHRWWLALQAVTTLVIVHLTLPGF